MKKFVNDSSRVLYSFAILFCIVMTSCKQEGLPIKVESVTLDITSLTMSVGETKSLTATIFPSDAENQKVLWSTSNTNIVIVKDGAVSAIAPGETIVTVKTDDGGKTAECAIVVKGTHEEGNDEGEEEEKWPVVLELSAVTATSVQFDMTLDINAISEDQEAGLIFSAVDDLDVDAEDVTIFQLDTESCSKVFTNLTYNTKYYYTTYLKKDGIYLYEEKEEFTTSNVLLDLSVASKTSTSAQISGTVAGLSESDKSLIEVGMFYSSEEGKVEKGEGTKLTATEIPSDNAVSFVLSDLAYITTYYYCPYVKQDDEYFYGEVKSFTTLEFASLPSGYINLATEASANCYIVSQAGAYCIPVVIGNASTEWLYKTVASEVLWESFGTSSTPNVGDLIKSTSYKDGYISFNTADTFKEGNTVIAAKDAEGNIIWSWHIWFTDQPEGQTYYNDAGTMMDRNLGATSATPGDVGALGLLYQWGRKDPFLGSSSISSPIIAKSTITWPSAVDSDSSNGTIAYATANPSTFITYNSKNQDWHYTGSSSIDNTRWTTSDKTKSIYDPCPAGWRIPDGGRDGEWSKALGSSESSTRPFLYDDTTEGMDFCYKFGSVPSIWYPASGHYNDDGDLILVGEVGYFCAASPFGFFGAYHLYLNSDGYISPSTGTNRAEGQSVRCVQE